MALTDLLSQLDQLDRDDKLRVIDYLMDILEKESAEEPSADEAAREDARWEESSARSQDMLARMAAKARQNRDRGLNQELDPDKL